MCLFVYFLMAFGHFKITSVNLPPPASTCILTSSQFCVFSIPLQAHHQEPERKATSLNVLWPSYNIYMSELLSTSRLANGSQCSGPLSTPQETELKTAYISLASNDEGLTLMKMEMDQNGFRCMILKLVH